MTSPPRIVFSAKSQRTAEPPISYLISVAQANPDLISFAAGLVDPLTLPGAETCEIATRVLSDPERAKIALQYGTTIGYAPLRSAVLKRIEQLDERSAADLAVTADNIVITNGSQQSLYLLADVLLNPGDIVIAESPSYFVFTGTLSSFGARIFGVPMDRDGMVVDELEKLLHRLETRGELDRVKIIYCTSYYQNPTGLTLSLERRQRLAEIVRNYSRSHQIVVLEDAAYRELRYDGPNLPSIKTFDPHNEFVVSSYTFSKPFAPGLRVGYSVMPTPLVTRVLEQKANHDFGSSNLCQHIAADALNDGSYDAHLPVVHAGYRVKRDAMLSALDRYMPKADGITWTHPQGGLYVWLSLPVGVDTSRTGGLFEKMLSSGVLYVPGEYCFQSDEHGHLPQNHIRLCYAVVPLEQIDPGIAILSQVLGEVLAAVATHSIMPAGAA